MKIALNRHGLFLSYYLWSTLAFLPQAHADTLANDTAKLLNAMTGVYSAEYAPSQWKASYASYDLNTELQKALQTLQTTPNLNSKQVRDVLKNFIYSMKDYHTSISFLSTEAASLPLTIKGTDSKYFLAYIDRTKLPKSSFPFEVGDEVVTFGDQPTPAAVAAVQAETPANVPSTDKGLAELYLTSRKGARGLNVPQGPVTLGIRPAGKTEVTSFQLVWNYTPEKIHPRPSGVLSMLGLGDLPGTNASLMEDRSMTEWPPTTPLGRNSLFQPRMTAKLADSPSPSGTENPYQLGGKKSFTPVLGTQIWESADTDLFHSYIYKTDDRHLIGYIRIASYEMANYDKAVAEFANTVRRFQDVTDALVIDQVNNPGGSVFYLYSLASMLTAQPLNTPRHRMAITQADVRDSLDTIAKLEPVTTDEQAKKVIGANTSEGFPVSYEYAQFTLNYARFVVDEWNAGRSLTHPYWIAGADHLNPADTHYSKPILLLINQLDFSGGDFFPAIMQDNKRVTVMGTRTAGAGGYVQDVQVPNNVGVDSFRCTESIAERADLNPIENLGVKPDKEYVMTENDFAKGYPDYVKAIQAAVADLTK